MSDAWIQTHTGLSFDILEPEADQIDIETIAHAGSQINRFTGHCRFPYPVAQHSYLGSFIQPPSHCTCASPREHAFRFLLHDGSESYIGDVSRPLKHFTTAGEEYRKVEKPIQDLIYQRYGLPVEEPKCIKTVDNWMLYAEKKQLLNPKVVWKIKWSDDEVAADVVIEQRDFMQNKIAFLVRFNELCRKEDLYQWSARTFEI